MPTSPQKPETQRLHKRIAASGICSRRKAEDLIREGRVMVNGEAVTEMGVQVGPDDVVSVDGAELQDAKTYTLVMYKPKGYVTTLSDPQGRPTVKKLLPDVGVLVKPVGRLDFDSSGLLIFTNDGELAHRLTHPRYGVEKEYRVEVEGAMTESAAVRLAEGVFIEGRKTAPADVILHRAGPGGSLFDIILHEGRNRQVRNMCEVVGYPVRSLTRTRIGPIRLKGLTAGQCRTLSKVEVAALKKLVQL